MGLDPALIQNQPLFKYNQQTHHYQHHGTMLSTGPLFSHYGNTRTHCETCQSES